jgi:outer membrane protein insertion porin family
VKGKRIARVLRSHRLRAAAGLLAGLLALMSVPACAAEPASPSGEVIAVEGNRRVDAETVRSYFHAGSDGHFDEAARDAALKSLIATGLFDKVSIDRTARGLVVHVTEAPVLNRVAFEGNKKVKDADLAAAVESKPRGTLRRAVIQADVNRIVEAYRHVGRDEVSVVPEIIDHGNDRADLVYVITEGAKTPVRRINFTGNKAFGARQLNAVIKTSATSILSFLTGGDVYDPDRIAQDREQIRLYYRSKGYADASVRSANAEYDPATKGFVSAMSASPLTFRASILKSWRAGFSPATARHSTATRSTRAPKSSRSRCQSSATPSRKPRRVSAGMKRHEASTLIS